MSYRAPYVDATGLHLPSYNDIIGDLVVQAQNIYGQQEYLGNDAALYQLLSVFALKASDLCQAFQLVYNNRSYALAIGQALDYLGKLSGIARKPASNSSAEILVSGTPNTVIQNGVVQDENGYLWDLPDSITIGSGGTVTANAVCETEGAISAAANTINIISTIVAGWTSATNPSQAVVGENVETDSQFRARLYLSNALPSITLLAGTIAALAATLGVTRSMVLENPTNTTDSYGNPPHSITACVEGGADQDVAMAIYNNRGMGCYTNGTTSYLVTDPNSGTTMLIRWDRPTYVDFTVIITVHLISGTSATIAAIQAAIVAYLNSLTFNELLQVSAISAAAMAVNPDLSAPLFTIRSLTLGFTSLVTSPGINSGGSGYVAGDIVAIQQSGSCNQALLQVTTVGGGGTVTGIALIQNGMGYSAASGVSTSGGTGTGLTVNFSVGTFQGTLDIALLFYALAQGLTGNVTVTSV